MELSDDDLKIFHDLRMQTWLRSVRPLLAMPSRLYHYTSSHGLLGILSEGQLRATNYAYLNDSAEMEFGRRIVHDELASAIVSARDDFERDALKFVAAFFEGTAPAAETYLTCFCAEGDLLSQWRGYGTDTGRFCLELDSNIGSPNQDYTFGNVIYEREIQTRVISRGASVIVAAFRQAFGEHNFDVSRPIAGTLAALGTAYLAGRAAFFKARAFREEQEWRAVGHFPRNDDFEALEFTVSGALIRPHIHLITGTEHPDGRRRLPITKVIVGATRYPREAQKSVEFLLLKNGYANVPVETSSVTLRT